MSTDPTGAAAPGIHSGTSQSPGSQGHDHKHEQLLITIPGNDNSPSDASDPSSIAVGNPRPDDATSKSKPTGLHSPPDSNNVDGSTDSELSDLDEAIANADDMNLDSPQEPASTATDADADSAQTPARGSAGGGDGTEARPDQPEQVPTPVQDEDIGEVVPDHWSGTVPVFRPTMDQFKDFKKFVRCPRESVS